MATLAVSQHPIAAAGLTLSRSIREGGWAVAAGSVGEGGVYLSVVIPAFNEEERITQTLRRVFLYLEAQQYASEVIVVDDGSRDHTLRALTRLEREFPGLIVVPAVPNRGKGSAVAAGVARAQGKYILMTDADAPVPIENVRRLLHRAVSAGAAFVVGARDRLRGNGVAPSRPWHRRALAAVEELLARRLVRRRLKDARCGFKLYRADAAKAVFSCCRLRGFGFDLETLALAGRMGLRVDEVAVAPSPWSLGIAARARPLLASVVGVLQSVRDVLRVKVNLALGRYRLPALPAGEAG
ncbi:MAG: glycosyltransferase [Planctomycetes bacterium]|nr:glycosyltransferase [Planctomycetota bacterium]